jgi:hypothetical protein
MFYFFLDGEAGTPFPLRHDNDGCCFSAYAKFKAHFITVLKITRETLKINTSKEKYE